MKLNYWVRFKTARKPVQISGETWHEVRKILDNYVAGYGDIIWMTGL